MPYINKQNATVINETNQNIFVNFVHLDKEQSWFRSFRRFQNQVENLDFGLFTYLSKASYC